MVHESVRRSAALAGNTHSGGQNWVPILPLALGRPNFSSWKLGVTILPSQGCCQDIHFKWLIAVGFHFSGKCFCDHPREDPYPERAMLQRDVKCTSWTRLFWKRQLGAALLLWVLLFFPFSVFFVVVVVVVVVFCHRWTLSLWQGIEGALSMESRNYIQCFTTLGAGEKNGLKQLHYLGKKNLELQAL